MLTRQGLMKARARALRQRTWFKTLSRTERSIVDLTIKCVERVKSRVLARIVSNIVAKILKTLKPSFLEIAIRIGREIAEKVSKIAMGWGNSNASGWRHDSGFIRFLSINTVNSGGFDIYGGHVV